MGGIQYPHLNNLAKKIWQWCEERKIWLFASYINTNDNKDADEESRKTINPDIEMSLSEEAFTKIVHRLGQPEIDLFASRTNAKCDTYPTVSTGQGAYPGCSEALRLALIRRGTPEAALNLTIASLAKNTLKQYNVSFKLWWSFCRDNNLNSYEPSMSDVILFLTEQFDKGSAYGTLNSHRSALSLLLGGEVSADVRIKRLLKGAFKLRPSVPKYNSTWDPQVVLNNISNWPSNKDLSLEQLTKKLVILLALCTAHRVQTLSLIKLNNIKSDANGIKIIISDLIKTSAPGRDQPVLVLPYYYENKSICPATVIEQYLTSTKELRPTDVNNLILTWKRPHRAASAQSISRWIKQVLADSGVDTTVFGAHSTRHASTSAASSAGISLNVIRRTASWTKTSETFARFYKRPISDESDFAKSILGNNLNDQ
ncbi:unnamed protein product [Plutella xylostella]|uniref:(diamondback moth) hypothetical protein n=1 Tax=Plutella xylostella TaxID=51655 RepID=A0A8S4EUF7_PLUXY|nr:unnamed protein product [Plutella xylostella]